MEGQAAQQPEQPMQQQPSQPQASGDSGGIIGKIMAMIIGLFKKSS